MTTFKMGQRTSRRSSVALIVALVSLLSLGMFSAGAWAETPAPGFAIIGKATPTDLPPGGEGLLAIYVYNLGALRSEAGATLTDILPEGLTLVSGERANSLGYVEVECKGEGSRVATCKLGAIPSGIHAAVVGLRVAVAKDASGSAIDRVSVSGGGALNASNATVPLTLGGGTPSAGLSNMGAWLTNENGTPDTQAGSHPYDMAIAFAINDTLEGPPTFTNLVGREFAADGEVRDSNVNLPAGLVGDARAVPQCPRVDLDESYTEYICPADTMIGYNLSTIGGTGVAVNPVYNMVPPAGVAAQFAFIVEGTEIFIDSSVRTGGDNGITSHIDNITQRNVTYNVTVLWGVPSAEDHNVERCEPYGHIGPECEVHGPPLFTLPTSCGKPLEFTAELLSTWQDESVTAAPASALTRDDEGNPIGVTGCERLQPFKPSIAVGPDTAAADTPAGLSTDITMPEGLNQEGLATPTLKDTTVTLPEGVVINPGQAKGLVACQPDQEALGDEPDGEVDEKAPSCPSASKVGTVEIETPLLREKMQGSVYVLQSNPPNLRLLVAPSANGVHLKIVGTVHLNEATGQLTTTFDETPPLPFTSFKLNFSGGAQAALVTPTGCGVYESNVAFTPWSSPFIEEAFDSSRFQITSGPAGGGSCTSPLPFSPTLTAGATTDQAGGYTNFSMLLQRGDGQQRIDALQFKAPAGLTGFLSHVPLCTNVQAETNTCPESSKIGHAVIESGAGPYPLVIPEAGQEPAPIYLTEAYGGAPFGLSIVVPLHVGPFTLETQRVRASVAINPYTSQLTVTTNPLPQEVAGVPTDLREVDAVIERPEFMVNPTDCKPQEFSGTAYGTPPPGQGGPGASASISSHFQVGDCQALKFEPKFTVSTSGKTSKADGASLAATVSYPSVPQGTDADIGYVKIELPKQLPSRLTTLQKACTSAQFEANPAACPEASKIGYATVHTPLLPVPLTGPAIFVSHGGEAFPSLTVVLQGDGVTIDLVGTTFISKAGITSTTFKTVPDDPFSTFELTLPQGKYSALTAIGDLCTSKLAMPTEFVAQNGAVLKQSTAITVTGCAKVKAPTRVQKLSKALSVCRKKDGGKARRRARKACEKTAWAKYGTAKKKNKKKGAK